ncbi:MAG: HEAT repeat domain-containing protein [Candidatus Binatia bacterium]
MRRLLGYLVVAFVCAGAPVSASGDLRPLVMAGNYDAIRQLGTGTMPELVRLYESADADEERARVANAFYQLGWKSEGARRALMRDMHTSNQDLRLSVQYALGRVSDDPAVVDALLENMQDDVNPLFRDKAACALAYDQVHLSEAQKVRLFAGLIHALGDPKPQVRAIAIQALEIHTGQRKSFAPDGDASARAAATADWREWLQRYQDSVR